MLPKITSISTSLASRLLSKYTVKKFRLPRKTKKRLSGFYLLPPDKDGNRQWCNPKSSQQEYGDVRLGRAEDMMKTWKIR